MKMKQLIIVISFFTFAYGFLLPRDLALKDPKFDPNQIEGPPGEVKEAMNILIRKFLINKQQLMMPNFDFGVFTQRAWFKTKALYNAEELLNGWDMFEDK